MAGRTIKEKFEAEAARAEAENPDEPETEPTEPTEPEPEPTDPEPSEDEAEEAAAQERADEEARVKAADARTDAQTQRLFDQAVGGFREALTEVFGVKDLEPSQTPGVIGFLLPGFTEQKSHSDYTRCQTCNGYGDVLTGSTKAGNETQPCPDPRCKGRGYWQKASAPPPAPPTPVAALTGPTAYDQPGANGAGEYAEAPAWLGDPNLSAGPTP